MLKTTMALICLAVSLPASAMTWDQRQRLAQGIDASISTVQAKYLPPKLVKNIMATATGSDIPALKEAFAQWPKTYSKSIGYENVGDGVIFYYQGLPLLKMRVVALEPYTLLLNDRTQVVLNKGESIAALKKALREEGFGEKGAKNAWFRLVPEAVADGLPPVNPALTFENSVFVTSDFMYMAQASKDTKEMVRQGYLLPDERYSWIKKFVNRDETMTCDGETAKGKIADVDGSLIEFEATRAGGIQFKNIGVTLKGAPNDINLPVFCKEASERPSSEDNAKPEDLLDSRWAARAKSNFINERRTQNGDEKFRECLKNEKEEALRTLAASRQLARYGNPYNPYDNRQLQIPREVSELLRMKCDQKRLALTSSEDYKAGLKKVTDEAEALWASDSARILRGHLFSEFVPVVDSCQQIVSVKPTLHLDCSMPKTVGGIKKLCAAVKSAAIRPPSQLEACFEDGNCDRLAPGNLSSLRQGLDASKKYNDAYAAFKKKYERHFAAGTLKGEGRQITIANPNILSGKELNQISDELTALADLRVKRILPSTYSGGGSPYVNKLLNGAMGLLDCCHDIECKKSLADVGVNLQPMQDKSTPATGR